MMLLFCAICVICGFTLYFEALIRQINTKNNYFNFFNRKSELQMN